MTASISKPAVETTALLPVVLEHRIDGARARDLYAVYLDSFAPLREQAAARQLMTSAEFFEEMSDPRISKYTAWAGQKPVALATVTNQLDSLAWISPDFYAARYPAHAARQAIFYLGIALVAPGRGEFRLLERLVQELVKPCVSARGVLAYDVCAFNNLTVQFGRRAETILKRVAPVRVSIADVQTYYQAVFE